MAIRLPVVLAQHPRKSGVHSECEESWITSLLFEERLDATLVSDLRTIELDSTDHLCLEGLKGDFVLVSWESANFVVEQLQRLGFGNFEVIPVDGSPRLCSTPHGQNSKKIFLIGYNPDDEVSKSVGRLKQLLESRAIPVFQLQVASNQPSSPRSLPVTQAPIWNHPGNETASHRPVSAMPISSEPREIVRTQNQGIETKDDDDFPNIDQLVDELDRFDS